MAWQIMNNVDLQAGRKIPLFNRSPFLEMQVVVGEDAVQFLEQELKMSDKESDRNKYEAMAQSINLAENMPSPRVIKSHLPLEFLPPNLIDTCKVIFVCRNPKDCCVSNYHHYMLIPQYKYTGNFKQYAQMFLDGTLEYGGYWTMLKSAWQYKDHPNMKIMWYEDMKKDLISVIRDTANFLGKHLTDYRVLQLDDHLYIENFRQSFNAFNDPKMAKFIRKGKVGDWKNYFTEENLQICYDWIAKNLEGTDIKMPFE